MEPVVVTKGDGPIILGVPHSGTHVPVDIFARLNETGQGLTDTDWHVDKLYADLLPGATMVSATFHRYVIDANRDPEGVSLYPGQNTTGLCPTTDFDGLPIYLEGEEPSAEEIQAQRMTFHTAYHDALVAEIARVKAVHGIAILYDCHSIRSHIPFLFDGTLPDFNVGTNGGATCAPAIEAAVVARTQAAKRYTAVLNGRFKGGWTTRHYGQSDTGVHAIQMELAQLTHLSTEAKPFGYDLEKAAKLRPHLMSILEDLASVAGTLPKTPSQKTENTLSGGTDNG